MAFYGLIAHLMLVLSNITLSGCTMFICLPTEVCLS